MNEEEGRSYKIVFKHYRFHPGGYMCHYNRDGFHGPGARGKNIVPSERGGLTECFVFMNDELLKHDAAACSIQDQFCYRLGRKIAFGRTLKKLRGTGHHCHVRAKGWRWLG